MELFFTIIVYMFFSCAVISFLFYILAIISLIKTVKGHNKKKRGLIFLALAMIFSYMPLKHLLCISITNKVMWFLIVIDGVMIYKFMKK